MHASKKPKHVDFTPELVAEIKDSTGHVVPIRVLCDTGTSGTLLLKKYVTATAPVHRDKTERTLWRTLGGTFVTRDKRKVKFKLPEFSNDKEIEWTVNVDDVSQHSLYDMIIGRDLINILGMKFDFTEKVIVWDNIEIPLKQNGQLQNETNVKDIYELSKETEIIQKAEEHFDQLLDADYSKVNIEELVNTYNYLTIEQRNSLYNMLINFPELFGGGLGTCNVRPVDIDLVPNAKPYHAKPYMIPQAYEAKAKKEIERLEKINVLKRDHDSAWAAGTFVKAKKTGDIRILTDFRQLNAFIKRHPFPLPRIADLLLKLQRFTWATALDLSMGYYHIPLTTKASKLCTIIMPWGKYRYLRLPMGIKIATDVFQNVMMELLGDLEWVRVYLDDILIITNGTYQDHLEKISIVLSRLQKAGFRANLNKCFFCKDSIEYLGYIINRQGIQPQPKKVEAIRRLQRPKDRRQLRHFLGLVNYYRDMWRRRSHILTPLSALQSPTVPYVWTSECEQAFEEIKRIIAKETILAYPNFNKPFHVYTDSSNRQLGAVIIQDGKPLAFYSRKLNPAQTRYPTGEQELLSIVETLKEFRNILLGQTLIIHTDHKNLLYEKSCSNRIMRWRLILEEYAPTYEHIEGKHNVVADALSRLNADFDMEYSEEMSTETQAETFMSEDDIDEYEFPLSGAIIHKYQQDDKYLLQLVEKNPNDYKTKLLERVSVIMYKDKIFIPKALRDRIVEWYHEYLQHPGESRTENTIRATMIWPNLKRDVQEYCKSCTKCQLSKKARKKYGHLPVKEDIIGEPWDRVDVDFVGPYTIRNKNGNKYTLRAMTMIDPITRWFEIAKIDEPTAQAAMEAFDNTWLSRYPRPSIIGIDNGSEFKGVFRTLCKNFGIKAKPSTEYNPQSKGTIERIHLTLGNMLRAFELENQDLDDKDPWTNFLSSAAFALHSTYHTVLGATPAQVVYGRDMLLPIKFKVDWSNIIQRKRTQVERDNSRENSKRIDYTYKVGDKILIEKPGISAKMTQPREGPYEILQVNTNGTVRIKRGPISYTINIRRISPFLSRTDSGGE